MPRQPRLDARLPSVGQGLWRGLLLTYLYWYYSLMSTSIERIRRKWKVINEESDTPVVRRARLLSCVQHWDQNTLRDFAKDCYDHVKQIIEKENIINKELLKRFEKIWTSKIYKHIPRQAAELPGRHNDELDWQVNRLLEYFQDSVKWYWKIPNNFG